MTGFVACGSILAIILATASLGYVIGATEKQKPKRKDSSFVTYDKDQRTTYVHDKKDISKSKVIWKIDHRDHKIYLSEDGGRTWRYREDEK